MYFYTIRRLHTIWPRDWSSDVCSSDLPLADGRPIVVTGAGHSAEVGEQLGGAACVLSEPEPRNSMPAIAWAAAVVEREDPDAVIGSFAADHLIGDEERSEERRVGTDGR